MNMKKVNCEQREKRERESLGSRVCTNDKKKKKKKQRTNERDFSDNPIKHRFRIKVAQATGRGGFKMTAAINEEDEDD